MFNIVNVVATVFVFSLSLYKTIHNDDDNIVEADADADANVVDADDDDDNDKNVDKQSICTESFV